MSTLDEVLATGRGIERSFKCPVHGDTHASASVNVLKGVWVCYACGAHGKTGEEIIPELDHIMDILAGITKPRTFTEAWLDMFDAHYTSPYWADRFGSDVAYANRCGTDPIGGDPTYPMRSPDGDVWGVVIRNGGTPKYLYPLGVSAATTLYGERHPAEVVVLVEGAADVMAIEQAGIPETWVVLGCYGAGTHIPQISLIADCGPKLVICAFDDDDAGRNAMTRTQTQLVDVAPTLSHHWSTIGVNDPADAPVADRVTAINNTIKESKYAKHAL